jgi:ubiquinone/menaquinone biosynthesis C-methylase UbiE
MLIPGRTVIDPACGTGDLIRGYDGMLTLCDTSKEVLELTAFSYQGADNIKIVCGDSLVYDDGQYDYCVMNR